MSLLSGLYFIAEICAANRGQTTHRRVLWLHESRTVLSAGRSNCLEYDGRLHDILQTLEYRNHPIESLGIPSFTG